MLNFLSNYSRVVAAAIGADYRKNVDEERFGEQPKSRLDAQGIKNRFFYHRGLVSRTDAVQTFTTAMDFIAPHIDHLSWLYSSLADDESRQCMVNVVAFRALGHTKIRLPLSGPERIARRQIAEKLIVAGDEIDSGFKNWKLQRMNLNPIGYPIEMYFNATGVVIDFMEQQYRCQTADGIIECEQGDVVIDAGGCWGDTALYFAHLAGADGQVISFEFLPTNLEIYRKNLTLNPHLSPRIRVVENAIWSSSGETLAVSECGPGTSVRKRPSDNNLSTEVLTIAIDNLILNGEYDRVDFIKMDIEGAELEALHGAEMSIKRFRPKLAITVYHKFEDFWTIPAYLQQLNLGYRFYLRHYTMHQEETVLYAVANLPDKRKCE
jgi:FkbM family methyltransferase